MLSKGPAINHTNQLKLFDLHSIVGSRHVRTDIAERLIAAGFGER